MLNRIKNLIIKEFKGIWSDKRIRYMILFAPIVQLLIFSHTATLEVKYVSMLIYDKDRSAYSRSLQSRFSNNKKLIKTITYVDNREEMADLINRQEALLALIIPQDFQKNLITGKGTELQFILDGRRNNSSQVFAGYAQSMVLEFQAEHQPSKSPISITTRNWYNPNLNYEWYIVIAMTAILAMMITLIITSLSLAQEKEFGTFDQILVSPLQPTEILMGKTIPAIAFALFDTFLMVLLGRLMFQVPFVGSLLVLLLLTIIFLLSMAGVGLFISALCKSQQQAILGVFSFMIPSLLISGFVSPVESMPAVMKFVGTINPLTYYLAILKGLFLKDISFALILQYTIPLILIATFCLTFTIYFFKRRIG
jgi:ABC-2 type transport system permease protein